MGYSEKYWHERYLANETGWDIGTISTPIKEYVDQLTDKSLKILVPGAGNSHEVEYLYNKGFRNVYLLEFCEAPIANFLKRLPNFPKNQIIQTDFFKHKGIYDLIIEQTFFSSLRPETRKEYIHKTHELLKPNGILVGLLFDIDFKNDFPPFGGNKEMYQKLFSRKFEIIRLEKSYNSIKPRESNELFVKMLKR